MLVNEKLHLYQQKLMLDKEKLKDFEKLPLDIEVYVKIRENGVGEIVIFGNPQNEDHNCDFAGCPIDSHVIFRAYLGMLFYSEVKKIVKA